MPGPDSHALARRHARDGIAVNAVSAGPLITSAVARIPGFNELLAIWQRISLLPWDPIADRQAVEEAVAFLLDSARRKITGQTLFVDGGASITGCTLLVTLSCTFDRNNLMSCCGSIRAVLSARYS